MKSVLPFAFSPVKQGDQEVTLSDLQGGPVSELRARYLRLEGAEPQG